MLRTLPWSLKQGTIGRLQVLMKVVQLPANAMYCRETCWPQVWILVNIKPQRRRYREGSERFRCQSNDKVFVYFCVCLGLGECVGVGVDVGVGASECELVRAIVGARKRAFHRESERMWKNPKSSFAWCSPWSQIYAFCGITTNLMRKQVFLSLTLSLYLAHAHAHTQIHTLSLSHPDHWLLTEWSINLSHHQELDDIGATSSMNKKTKSNEWTWLGGQKWETSSCWPDKSLTSF